MPRGFLSVCCLLVLVATALAPLPASAAAFSPAPSSAIAASYGVRPSSISPSSPSSAVASPADWPVVDPDYIYAQLEYMATRFQRREAGYNADGSGHDAFAAYWAGEMQRDLAGFASETSRFSFDTLGWQGRAPVVPATNVEITVPGALHPEQVVVVGCHYDGEAISTQSANDDASGCAIELGVAKALGEYWRAHHLSPARTLRFVAFDAEEQGLIGSIKYVNSTVNGGLSNVVAMFNEEQSGIAYPLRFLGRADNPQLPLDIALSPLQANDAYPQSGHLTPAQREHIAHFRDLMAQAAPAVFAQFRALGYTSLAYHDSAHRPVSQPIFTPDQTAQLRLADDTGVGSDQIPFTEAGVACATFYGNDTYYQTTQPPPPWSYPYDQPDDTIQLMNTFADGTSTKAPALALALALPGMLTTWMLHQPDVLGETPADNAPVAAIDDIGQTLAGKPLSLAASSVPDPAHASSLSYAWDFGDGTTATGPSVTHTYAQPGAYTLRLTVTNASGTRQISTPLNVTTAPAVQVPEWTRKPSGHPRANPAVTLPQPDDRRFTPSSVSQTSYGWLILLLVIIIAAGATGATFAIRRHRHIAALTKVARLTSAADAERQRRIDALDALARDQQGSQPSERSQTPPDPGAPS